MDRSKLEDLLKRRFFYDQSFAIYGGISGLYDYGPMGCALKSNIVQQWRKHFILAENMLEVECSALTPERVLKASGHVDRFVDWMKKETTTQVKAELIDILNRLDGLNNKDMHQVITTYGFKSPSTGNDLSEPVSFNLMFPTQIGPTGDFKAYLRPETAQGIFINFKRLLEFNQGKLPFAAAQIGAGFRNEISPRQGLIRVREFTMCEIEHFVDPDDKKHAKFSKVANVVMTLFTACDQVDNKGTKTMTIGEAVEQGIVDNETLGYYMARTHLFLESVGVHKDKLRFRQHMSTEMAHYAKDCWDAECRTSYGWIECVGHADRACYDLSSHSKATGVKLQAEQKLPAPRKENLPKAVFNKANLGQKYKASSKQIVTVVESYDVDQLNELRAALDGSSTYPLKINDEVFQLTKDLVEVRLVESTVHVEVIVPSVIEPSFGVGRIMYAVLEHAFRQRDGDEKRLYLELPASIAPVKCSILTLMKKDVFNPLVDMVQEELSSHEHSFKVDDGAGSIGRRYSRTDEIGIPFGVTIDYESVDAPHTVTLRHAQSMQQIRIKISELGELIEDLVKNRRQWADVIKEFPVLGAAVE
uniref:glycine--tRNA ligase n=1 Tax=Ditylenchus dipsaci TaxID=166011 RepID=A0A915E3P4_9BILA